MAWSEKIEHFEATYDWKASVALLDLIAKELKENEKVNLVSRVLFLITYWLVEGTYSKKEEKEGTIEVFRVYQHYGVNLQNNADFLFCIGVITRLNEWLFQMDISQPDRFIYKSIDLAPDILLYKVWLRLHTSERFLSSLESQELDINSILDSPFVQNWRKEKGLLGNYVVDYIETKR